MLPVVAIAGRPNVGKSTLFNWLTRSRDALVDDAPGITRDRLYGLVAAGDRQWIVIDTGGLTDDADPMETQIRQQVESALEEADAVLFVTDGREGRTPQDVVIAERLRRLAIPVYLLVNKTEGYDRESSSADFHALGLGQPYAISAMRGTGIRSLIRRVLDQFPEEPLDEDKDHAVPKIAAIGRPNVGKSTLINSLAGESRVIVSDTPGTTRDAVTVPVERGDARVLLIDTAGVRRRSRIQESIERFSVVKTMQAVVQADVALFVVDAREGLTEQDAAIAGIIQDSGTAFLVLVNKWDGLETVQKTAIRRNLKRRLSFLPRHETLTISALHGSGVGGVLDAAMRAFDSASIEFRTADLNTRLGDAVRRHAPPLHRGRAIKIKYVHQGGRKPPTLVIHGNQVEHLPSHYLRYLSRYFQDAYRLVGCPVRIKCRTGRNPYQKKNAARRPASGKKTRK